ncbi:UvrD-helicase domain-containing protein [Pelagibius litoralis]|uniref:DNA 3'-5' helicase n=1 Tax=Pelagibius litoralis TaxID=374515 RepID=A0A967C238_9PROT|nr:UvrD-helicase domain-containing protein [Pelagibius litoralis]NIA68656.1 UvrD-helicase domain-containing protein [Pelagibius litoralis]
MSDLFAAATPAHPYPYLDALNEGQRAAVEALDGPVLVLAGAGTGKTRVLTTRLGHLLMTGRVRAPGELLAVTFTNKAAREMKDRVAALLERPSVEGWWLGTFHAIAVRILRRNPEAVGLRSNFTILDTDDQVRLVKQILQSEAVDEKKWPARALLSIFERWKDRGLTPEKVSAGEAGDFARGRAVELYKAYQERLRTLNACDFGDLLLHNLTLFQNEPEVLADYHRRFRYILVDEYQDTNVAQYLWLRLLAQGHKNICCVGDDDQSIYGWRGAEVGNILRFEEDFPGAKVIRLERNYRSTGRILAAASGLIAHNEGRLGKTLWTEGDEGEKLRLRGLWDGEAEARFVGEEIEAMQARDKDLDLNQIAILVRTGAQTREFEERFITLGLPYRVVGGPRFYERMEIRDALAYLRVIHSPDDDLAFERIMNKPKRGLGNATLQLLYRTARAGNIPLTLAVRRLVETDELRPAARRALGNLLRDFDRWRAMVETTPHPELAEIVLEESGYTEMWMNDKSLEAPGRLENLKEFVNALGEFENLAGFLEHVSLVMEALSQEGQDVVTIMTLHAAKGLEFDTVFLPGWEEGLFPNQRALDETGRSGLEEERRLAYVGLTRARKQVVISFAANRRMHGSWAAAIPSRFVDELPSEHVAQESDHGVYGAAASAFGGMSEWSEARVSPGLARAKSRRGETGSPFIDVTPTRIETIASGAFQRGDRVFHQKFGYGSIASVEGERLNISFDKAGEKKVIASFVVPADQAG